MDDATKKEVDAAILAALKPITDASAKMVESVTELAKNHKIFADTYAADRAAIDKAAKDAADKAAADAGGEADKNKAGTAAAAKVLDEAAVGKIVADALANDRKSQQTSAEQKTARAAFIADSKNGIARLPAEFADRLGADQSKWADEAKAIKASWEKFATDNKINMPDVGGANREGGDAVGGAGAGAGSAGAGNKYEFIKMPVAPANLANSSAALPAAK